LNSVNGEWEKPRGVRVYFLVPFSYFPVDPRLSAAKLDLGLFWLPVTCHLSPVTCHAVRRKMVRVVRFELTTSCAQGTCATRLRYTLNEIRKAA
jgi:hypothetical protein